MKVEAIANHVVDHCDSTNNLARQLGDCGYPHGTWVSARVQDSGRGRLGRKWESLEGNLFLSMIFRSKGEDKSLWSWVPMVTAIGVVDALRAWEPALDVRIKWPNDLWILNGGGKALGAKLGGILCEAVGNSQGSFIIAGIGLNCLYAPSGLDQRTASLSEALGGKKITADRVRGVVIDGIRNAYCELQEYGVATLLARYESRAAIPPGSEIEWVQSWAGQSRLQSGEVLGLGQAGELLVKTSRGEKVSLFAEDVKVRPKAARKATDEFLP